MYQNRFFGLFTQLKKPHGYVPKPVALDFYNKFFKSTVIY
jgi:hypothetical protein